MTDHVRRTGVVALVPDRWQGIWMPRHQVMSRLARYFRVVWLEPADNWRRYWLPGQKPQTVVQNVSAEIPNFDRYVPGRWHPEVYKPRMLGSILRRHRLARAVRRLRHAGCDKIVLYLWRPIFAWAADAVATDMVCYHVDDEYQFTPRDVPENPVEVRLLQRADLVVIHSPKLLEKKGRHNGNTIFVPNGVDYPLFSSPCAEPADLGAISRPRAGYVGVIKSQLDFKMLVDLCTRRSDWSFAFVGPRITVGGKESELYALEKLSNVHFLGNRQLAELPAYMQHMDACMMCYEVNAYTDCIYPLKAHEYLATGRPVISSPIRAMRDHAEVVRLATTADDWSAALDWAVTDEARSTECTEARQAVAAAHDWNALVDRIADGIVQCLDGKAAEAGTPKGWARCRAGGGDSGPESAH